MKMMIMAQHPQQHHDRQKQPTSQAVGLETRLKTLTNVEEKQQQQQQEQDGKRTLIKNQLYLIEQLQLENANLRNERDQLQLEIEELKFQLQMISSSNILHQPGATFNNQQLERLVDTNEAKISNNHNNLSNVIDRPSASATTSNSSSQVKLLATPLRQPLRLNGVNQPDISSTTTYSHLPVRFQISDATKQPGVNETSINIPISTSRLLSGKSTSLSAFNAKSIVGNSQGRNIIQDDDEQRVKLVEQRYGDSEKVHAAAIVIQRAFRKYQICKRFRTITEQLRHTCQSVCQLERTKRDVVPKSSPNANASSNAKANVELPFGSGSSRAAAWESLSQAASRLAASASAATSGAKQSLSVGVSKLQTSQQQAQQIVTTMAPMNVPQQSRLQSITDKSSSKQDPVVAAAINFQQLESIRKRQYRVGLNIFNKSPEKGVSFLVAHSFIDSSSPYTKTSASFYHSNQLHFIDKQNLLQQQALSNNVQSCQLCWEEENLKRNVAHFLLHRKGLSKEKIGLFLGNLQVQFNQDVLKYYLQELDFYGLQVDLALRKFLSTFRLPGEAQKIERIVDCFAQRYVQCQQQQQPTGIPLAISQIRDQQASQQQIQNQQQITPHSLKNNLMLLSRDEIFILTFAIIMLNTDLHSPSLKPTSRMSASQFVNNLRGVFKSQSIVENDLIEIYERVKANQISTTPDHVTHVMKVQQGLTVNNFQRKELLDLCVPYRRLVCFCRLFEVYDINKKERIGQHQREIFLFNDLLLVTKLARRVRNNTPQLYTYRQSIPLRGLYVQLFQSTHYNFGIRLCQRSNDEILIMFNARNELDQSRFVEDLSESIAEMDEMEAIKTHNIIETIHFKYLERLRRHALIHSSSENIQTIHVRDDNNKSKMDKTVNNCDIRNSNDCRGNEERQSTDNCRPFSSIQSNRVQMKSSSMSNLNNVEENSVDDNDGLQSKGLRLNQSFAQHEPRQLVDIPNRNDHNPENRRRCSTSSVHSLDSGLFLSRDVSPNQSN